eukprot:scaffold357_cov400-Prasinococcus_capsulatus_cf.AAC.8
MAGGCAGGKDRHRQIPRHCFTLRDTGVPPVARTPRSGCQCLLTRPNLRQGLPTVVLFIDGVPHDRIEGFVQVGDGRALSAPCPRRRLTAVPAVNNRLVNSWPALDMYSTRRSTRANGASTLKTCIGLEQTVRECR